jgi:hypothetical protein
MEFFGENSNQIKLAFDLLKKINKDGFFFESIDKDGNLLISNNSEKKIKFNVNAFTNNKLGGRNSNYSETSDMSIQLGGNNTYSETSDMFRQLGGNNTNYSETSDMLLGGNNTYYSETSDMSRQLGGKNTNYSETSDMSRQLGGKSSLKFSETSDMYMQLGGKNNNYSETSDMSRQLGGKSSLKFSETSDIYMQLGGKNNNYSETSDMVKMQHNAVGGSKNIFQKIKYSDTSSVKMSNNSNYSKTSSEVLNGKNTEFSETSINEQKGGHNGFSETLSDISELRQRVNNKSSYLDMRIFKKNQMGGSIDTNIRKKMMDIGINSNSSTSEICE